MTLAEVLDAAARKAIRAALATHKGNVRRAAEALKISDDKLHREINRLDLRAEADAYPRAGRQPAGA